MDPYRKVTLRPHETRSLKARQGEVTRGDDGAAVGMSHVVACPSDGVSTSSEESELHAFLGPEK